MNVGLRIKKRRKELGMRVDDLAKKVNKNKATIYRYENGEIEKLPTDVLIPIAEALQTTPAYLIGWEDETGNEIEDEIEDIIYFKNINYDRIIKLINDFNNEEFNELEKFAEFIVSKRKDDD